MPVRTNGGVFYGQILTGSLKHYRLSGADFTGALDINFNPVPGSAADVVYELISSRATVGIMNPVTSTEGMSFALETNRAGWETHVLQAAIRNLGTTGVDNVNLSAIELLELPYDFLYRTPKDFIELEDTPADYTGSANYAVVVNPTEDGLVFSATGVGGDVATVFGRTGDVIATKGDYTLDLLGDTSVSAPMENDTIVYESGQWVNKAATLPTLDSAFVTVSTDTLLSVNKKYIVTANAVTVTLPDVAVNGDTIVIAKTTTIASALITTTGTDMITTDIGDDTTLDLDITEDISFTYNNGEWNTLYGAFV